MASLRGAGASGRPHVSAAFREHLVAYAAQYLTEGDTQLMEYRDTEPPQALRHELTRILQRSPYLPAAFPSLAAAVGEFRGTLPPNVGGFLYWSQEKVGPKTVVSLTHSLITGLGGGVTAIATKQIYASHYFTASLGVTLLIETPDAASPDTLVIYLNRSRVDIFGGLFGGAKRSVTRSRARSTTARMMQELKVRLEREFRDGGQS